MAELGDEYLASMNCELISDIQPPSLSSFFDDDELSDVEKSAFCSSKNEKADPDPIVSTPLSTLQKRKSVSLIDVSKIDNLPMPIAKTLLEWQNVGSLSSVGKSRDSGYNNSCSLLSVNSGSKLCENNESRRMVDSLVEECGRLTKELHFSELMINTLQESNNDLRMKCAISENKLTDLRLRCMHRFEEVQQKKNNSKHCCNTSENPLFVSPFEPFNDDALERETERRKLLRSTKEGFNDDPWSEHFELTSPTSQTNEKEEDNLLYVKNIHNDDEQSTFDYTSSNETKEIRNIPSHKTETNNEVQLKERQRRKKTVSLSKKRKNTQRGHQSTSKQADSSSSFLPNVQSSESLSSRTGYPDCSVQSFENISHDYGKVLKWDKLVKEQSFGLSDVEKTKKLPGVFKVWVDCQAGTIVKGVCCSGVQTEVSYQDHLSKPSSPIKELDQSKPLKLDKYLNDSESSSVNVIEKHKNQKVAKDDYTMKDLSSSGFVSGITEGTSFAPKIDELSNELTLTDYDSESLFKLCKTKQQSTQLSCSCCLEKNRSSVDKSENTDISLSKDFIKKSTCDKMCHTDDRILSGNEFSKYVYSPGMYRVEAATESLRSHSKLSTHNFFSKTDISSPILSAAATLCSKPFTSNISTSGATKNSTILDCIKLADKYAHQLSASLANLPTQLDQIQNIGKF